MTQAYTWFASEYQKSGKKLDMGKGCVRFKSLEDLALDVRFAGANFTAALAGSQPYGWKGTCWGGRPGTEFWKLGRL
jgi:hypothetical protein